VKTCSEIGGFRGYTRQLFSSSSLRALSSEEAVIEGEGESEGVDATELSLLGARVSAC